MSSFLDSGSGWRINFSEGEALPMLKTQGSNRSFVLYGLVMWSKSYNSCKLLKIFNPNYSSVLWIGKLQDIMKKWFYKMMFKNDCNFLNSKHVPSLLAGSRSSDTCYVLWPWFPKGVYFCRHSGSEHQLFANNLISITKCHLWFGYHEFILQGL